MHESTMRLGAVPSHRDGAGHASKMRFTGKTWRKSALKIGLSMTPALLVIVSLFSSACHKKTKKDDCSELYGKLKSCTKDLPVKKDDFVGLCWERHSDPVVAAQLACDRSLSCKPFQACLDQARTKGAVTRLEQDLAKASRTEQTGDILLRCDRYRNKLTDEVRAQCRKRAKEAFDQQASALRKMRDRADTKNLWQACGPLQQASRVLGKKEQGQAKLLCEEVKASPAFRAVLLSKPGSLDHDRACKQAAAAMGKLSKSTWAKAQLPLVLGRCAKAAPKGAKEGSDLVLKINGSQGMLLAGQKISSDTDLDKALSKAHEAHPKAGLVLDASADTPYARIVSLLDRARKAGFVRIGVELASSKAPKAAKETPPAGKTNPSPARKAK